MNHKSNKQKPNKALMFKANDLIRKFADQYGITHCSFSNDYKMLVNGQNVMYLFTNRLEYRVEGSKEVKYLPVGEKNMFAMLKKELNITGEGMKTVNLIRIVR